MDLADVVTDAGAATGASSAATDDFEHFYQFSCLFLMICSAVAIYISCPQITLSSDCPSSFYSFRRRYLVAWYVCATVDWLQGAFLFSLYDNVLNAPTAILMAVGFGSSIFMAPLSGFLGDKFGRRRCCLLYCITYAIACTLLHLGDFLPGLLLGRVLSAFAQQTLFTSFESYLVTAFFHEGLPSHTLDNIFAWMYFGNFLCAVLFGGLLAQVLVDNTTLRKGAMIWTGDHLAPFSLALLLCIVGGILIWNWKDDLEVEPSSPQESAVASTTNSIRSTAMPTSSHSLSSAASVSKRKASSFVEMGTTLCGALRQRDVQLCGVAVIGVEAPMFFLILHFYDTLKAGGAFTCGGYVFASFMMCSMMGSTLCSTLSHLRKERLVLFAACSVAFGWLIISVGLLGHFSRNLFVPLAFVAFNIIEMGIGLYFPSIGMVKSGCVPEEVRSSVYTMYRLPLNIIVMIMATLRVIQVSGPLGTLLSASAVAAMLVLGASNNQARSLDVELSRSF
eukprot:TRINITY_DN7057_c0_g4_i1.p1 TRINITY_DN7057_c0_g4~~TRINITY_DN7057_c0_g4_i1.p1  ORF type:complete len:506 (+),score=70.24 TRINITY_DN7057_c0_g4_i1:55-1572(+)